MKLHVIIKIKFLYKTIQNTELCNSQLAMQVFSDEITIASKLTLELDQSNLCHSRQHPSAKYQQSLTARECHKWGGGRLRIAFMHFACGSRWKAFVKIRPSVRRRCIQRCRAAQRSSNCCPRAMKEDQRRWRGWVYVYAARGREIWLAGPLLFFLYYSTGWWVVYLKTTLECATQPHLRRRELAAHTTREGRRNSNFCRRAPLGENKGIRPKFHRNSSFY